MMGLINVVIYAACGFTILKYLCKFLLAKFRWGKIDPDNELVVKGRIVLVTGANAGIGKATCLELAQRGATVVMACRNMEAAEEAIQEIETLTGNAGKLDAMKLDLASLQSVREFAAAFKAKYDHIDILINNAGVYDSPTKKLKTQDGFEIHFGVNHLGHFLLTNLLLPMIKKSTLPARIVNLSSMGSNQGKLDFNDLQCEHKTFSGNSLLNIPYCNSKLANVLFTRELGKRLKSAGIRTYALCPGLVETEIVLGLTMWQTVVIWITYTLLAKDTTEGCQTTLFCALSNHKDVVEKTGEMYRNCGYWPAEKRITINDEDAVKLWKISEGLVKLI